MSLDKRLHATDIVSQLRSGMTLGIGGWGPRRKPMALVRALLRSDISDLTVVSYGGPDVGMLCAAGKVKKLIFAFVSLDVIPLEPWFRKAREAGDVAVLELDEGMFQWGLKAAAFGLPFLPTRVGLGTDLLELGGLKMVQSPYPNELYPDGEMLVAMPALSLDAALIHVTRCDWRGNVQALGPDVYYDEWFAKAAKATFVSCEEIVPAIEDAYPEDVERNIFARCFVTGVAHTPGGAHPTSMPPTYGWDLDWLKRYTTLARDPGDWAAVQSELLGDSEIDYQARLGGIEAIRALSLPIF